MPFFISLRFFFLTIEKAKIAVFTVDKPKIAFYTTDKPKKPKIGYRNDIFGFSLGKNAIFSLSAVKKAFFDFTAEKAKIAVFYRGHT